MEKTEITLEYTEQTPHFGKMLLPKKEPKKPFPWKALLQGGGFCLMGLFWGRIELMGLLRPMGLALSFRLFRGGVALWGGLACGRNGGICHAPLKTGAGLAAALAIQLTLGRFLERQEMGKKALLGTFASVLAGIFFAVSRQGLGFYFAIAAVEGALTLGISYLVQKGVVLLLEHGKAVIPSREEMLSLLLLAGGVLAGLASLQNRRSAHFCCRWHLRFFCFLPQGRRGSAAVRLPVCFWGCCCCFPAVPSCLFSLPSL